MYRKDIENVFDIILKKYTTDKCSRVAQARRNGAVVSIEEDFPTGEGKTIVYEDGSEVHIDDSGNITHFINSDGVEMDYLGVDSYDFFESQKNDIISKYGRDGYNFLKRYAHSYASMNGVYLNRYLRGLITKDELESKIKGWWNGSSGDYDLIVGEHDRFLDMLKNINLPNEDFFSVRFANNLHDNDGVDKGVVSDKAHMCSTTGATTTQISLSGLADPENCWKIITDFSGQENVKGVFLGTAIKDKRGRDWEKEVNHAPGQKFERTLIDEENKIIVQRPYKNP